MKPVYKIETYTGAVLDHTLTDTAFNIKTKEVLTSNVGTFQFSVPAQIGSSYKYYDIAVKDKVKIYLGYNTISASDLVTIGKIYRISGTLSSDTGYIRTFYGRNQGEILQRRMKGEKDWNAVGASTIVTELANDLGLGVGDIVADATAETHRIDVDKHEKYFDLLRKVSDYWANAGSQVKKDFFVDTDNDLVWKARPIRTVGVETLTVGGNIISYQVVRDLTPVKNKIWVYGQKLKPEESTKDAPTEMADAYKGSTVDVQSASGQKVLSVASTADFSIDDTVYIFYADKIEENTVDTIQAGVSLTMDNNLANTYPVASGCIVYPGWGPYSASTVVSTDAVTYCVGSKSTKIVGTDGGGWCGAIYKFDGTVNLNHYPSVNFFIHVNSEVSGYVRFQDTAGKYAYKVFSAPENDGEFHFIELACGRDNEKGWIIESGFDWTDVYTVEVSMYDGTMTYYVDGLYLDSRRFSNCATSGAADREMVMIDEALTSDSDCQKRAEALLYQLENTPVRIDVATLGNTNIKIGDRLSVTIPAENISAANYDVVEVIHTFTSEGFRTAAVMVNSANYRDAPGVTVNEILTKKFVDQREIGRGIGLLK